ncbi:alpha/beta fold hydrolase [Acidocella sp.]|uniref:alpha/beta fold hydrolase n=1 Tax=Acidocella sp. TaxID=50710 RepID=UPI00262E6701|nr:alpha/beta fold hydrolase [Acidocella sp.]
MILNVIEAGSGPPLVLLHGLFGTARNLGVLSRALSTQFRVLAMDLRNHGHSPHAAKMSYRLMAEDVAETLAARGIARAAVVGHSMGGKTAMMLALTRPEMVTRLAVLDIAPLTYSHEYDDYVRAMLALPLTPGLTRGEADAALAKTVKAAPMRAFLLNNLVLGEAPHWRMGLREIADNMAELLRWDDPPGLRPYPAPALFLCGGDSDYVPPSAEPEILSRFPRAVIRRIPGAAHWLHADKPREVIAALREFFTDAG